MQKAIPAGVKFPKWLSHNMIDRATAMVLSVPSTDWKEYLRTQCLTMQSDLKLWRLLVELKRQQVNSPYTLNPKP